MKKILINETGNIYDRLTVIEHAGLGKNKNVLWYCRCICGNYSIVTGSSLRLGKVKSCGCSRRKGPGVSYLNHKLRRYKLDAKKRKLEWGLSKEDFLFLITQSCHYCGASPTNPKINLDALNTFGTKRYPTGTIPHNGIDRIDNDKGYTIRNTVPCCKNCNWGKGTKTIHQFKDWIRQVYLTWGRL